MPLTPSDFLPGSLSGSSTLASKKAEFTRTVTIDGIAEGNEKFIARLRQYSTSGRVLASTGIVRINDTSIVPPAAPTYNLAANPTLAAEGQAFTFTLSTIGVADGTTVPYTITGVASSDIVGGALVGNFTVNSMGVGTAIVTARTDDLDFGDETMTVTLTGISPAVSVSVLIRSAN